MSARDDVLARIADAHRLAPSPDLPYDAVERAYRGAEVPGPDAGALVDLLVDRLLDYKALVRRTTPDGLAGTVAEALRERGATSLVVPEGVDPAWLASSDVRVVADPGPAGPLTVDALDTADGVLTGCALAVAATGTLVLDGTAGQGRRAVTLVPDYHLCVVRADQVVADVPQAVAGLEPTRPTTMISGPSATSDIELNRVEGVHGPRTLEVVLVEDAGPDRG
ncbi:LutC/YkgG family protein [Microlunatus flavus]|uniref:L-lactate dehydrogenase complex protein LldG n=1 Tax=Microlunatus flavus TaxID=1036181 RepID=A0A1H9DAG9_9ACTN|nr:LUD domain-containing protein [Microlunatus flavus]SEQ10351.1 L-lactate dehydrogenase complex protein LldG [Microlunatus flavus]